MSYSTLYRKIEQNMPNRLELLAIKYDRNIEDVIMSYIHREEVIRKAYHKDYKGREARILYYAYKGVERDLEAGKKKELK